jgi:transposase
VDVPLPACCPDCGGELVHERDAEQFVTDLPDLRPVVTRYRIGVGRCVKCHKRVQGRHQDQRSDALGAAGSMIGPGATALSLFLHYGLGLSFGKCAELLGRLGVPVTAGALCSSSQQTGTALVPLHQEIVKKVNDSPVVVSDETGWRVGGLGAWLWVATSATATAYNVAAGRGFCEATELIDEDFAGVLVRDGWAPYRGFTSAEHQTCVAHLLRRCDEMIADLPDWARSTPVRVKKILVEALGARKLSRAKRRAVIEDLSELVELLGEYPHPHDENRKLVKHLVNESGALFTFLARTDVDATNWRAEQAIRPAVVNRKVWGGNRTWRGAATQGRVMSVLRTASQQGIDPVEFLSLFARAPDPGALSLFA